MDQYYEKIRKIGWKVVRREYMTEDEMLLLCQVIEEYIKEDERKELH
jgi:hypothetical protein